MSPLDCVGSVVVEYKYDAWGNHEAEVAEEEYSVLAEKNPFRYRGYYYDTETNLYYLQTRYYDPEVGRFISRDSIEYAAPESINGLNLYAYCSNNPVMNVDPTGTTEWWEWLLAIGLGTISGYFSFGAYSAYGSAKSLGYSGWALFGYTLTGLVVGNYFVVTTNWDAVSDTIKMDGYKFRFEENPYFNLWTAYLYAKYIKQRYYQDEPSRTTLGLYIELVAHYPLYLLGIESGKNGADMGPAIWEKDWSAVIAEGIAMTLTNPYFPFFGLLWNTIFS